MQTPDDRAVQILLDTYWSSSGWRDGPAVAGEDLRYAVEAGLMFEAARKATHDEVVALPLSALWNMVRRPSTALSIRRF